MARFYSKCNNYQILVTPTTIDVKANIPLLTRGKKIEFKDGEYETDNSFEIGFLRKHAGFGVDFVEDTPKKDNTKQAKEGVKAR